MAAIREWEWMLSPRDRKRTGWTGLLLWVLGVVAGFALSGGGVAAALVPPTIGVLAGALLTLRQVQVGAADEPEGAA